MQNDNMDPETVREFVTDIGAEAQRLQRTTEKLLDLSRLDDNVQVAPQPVDVKQVSLDVLPLLRPLAAEKNVVMVFAAVNGEKATLMVSVTDDLTEKGYHAGNMIKEIAKAAGGGGGGKADMAQAGAKDLAKLPDAFAKAEELMAAKAK